MREVLYMYMVLPVAKNITWHIPSELVLFTY